MLKLVGKLAKIKKSDKRTNVLFEGNRMSVALDENRG